MGGGDLNLKKSWHPHTMKNQERVWKAEQKDSEEKKRIAELQREIIAERDKEDMQKFAENSGVVKKKDDVKLEWMYKGPSQSVNHEEYLLGKAIDKNFERYNNEQRGGPSQDEESLPDAVRQAKSSMFNEQVDVQRKMNEDPLMAIRQRAVEKAKELYNNPVRLKQIRKMVSKSEGKSHKKEKKKKKKSKKSSLKDEERELDALLTAKLKNALKDRDLFKKLKKKARKNGGERSSSSSSSSGDDEESEDDQSNSKNSRLHSAKGKNPHERSQSPQDKRARHSKFNTDEEKRRSRSPRSYNRREYHDHSRKRSRSRSIDRERQTKRRDYPRYVDRSLDERKRHENQEAHGSRRREVSPERKRNYRDRSSSASDTEKKRRNNQDARHKKKEVSSDRKKTYRDRSSSGSDDDRERNIRQKSKREYHSESNDSDDNPSRGKIMYGLMMADGSKPVVRPKPTQQEVKSSQAQPQKPVPWQKKERVKLTEEEKEKRRQEMLSNAAWRDKEREENVKRYRMEEAHEKKQLHENFDDDFARKQFSKATDQISVEGRIKSKLNTIQRSKMSMDQNFARR
ncbi:Pre-mRNA-splicing factor CWC25-like protein [Frankliniella fusca]|uniref:Pre-mRNA-splicing factor CWC25-like protein n=1 Tax=Frankliniella fusca TaxID=407009 RepID=A0AAE1GTB0_9NEOP|nr:Pre-mRNA-splicing factor CWC25-like protein [Frankliniella fusca]